MEHEGSWWAVRVTHEGGGNAFLASASEPIVTLDKAGRVSDVRGDWITEPGDPRGRQGDRPIVVDWTTVRNLYVREWPVKARGAATLIPEEVRALVLRAHERHGLSGAARVLNDSSVPPPGKSKQWYPNTVRRIVKGER